MTEITVTIPLAAMIAIAMVLFASAIGASESHARAPHHRAVAPWRRHRPF